MISAFRPVKPSHNDIAKSGQLVGSIAFASAMLTSLKHRHSGQVMGTTNVTRRRNRRKKVKLTAKTKITKSLWVSLGRMDMIEGALAGILVEQGLK